VVESPKSPLNCQSQDILLRKLNLAKVYPRGSGFHPHESGGRNPNPMVYSCWTPAYAGMTVGGVIAGVEIGTCSQFLGLDFF